MKILTLRQFLQQQGVEPQEPECQEVRVISVRGFLDAVQNACEDDWILEIKCDCPEPGSLSLRFKAPDDTE